MRPIFILLLLTAGAMAQPSRMATTINDRNRLLRLGKYRDDCWTELTGKSVDDLWREFVSTLTIP